MYFNNLFKLLGVNLLNINVVFIVIDIMCIIEVILYFRGIIFSLRFIFILVFIVWFIILLIKKVSKFLDW